ncbi:MAG: hypothetical protein KBG15_23010 [Kofleriaceae bacterium]|nr:hypothetical protein [Kofleriaceae bacterium]
MTSRICIVLMFCATACANTRVSKARFVARSPAGGTVATPSAEEGMDDANEMITAHCGRGGHAIAYEGEAIVGATVVAERANSVDAQTNIVAGQVQGHDSTRTVVATGSRWQMQYTCNDPSTVNMGLITRTRVEPTQVTWGVNSFAGVASVPETGDAPTEGYRRGHPIFGLSASVGYRLGPQLALSVGAGLYFTERTSVYTRTDNPPTYFQSTQELQIVQGFVSGKYYASQRISLTLQAGVSDSGPIINIAAGYNLLDLSFGKRLEVGVGFLAEMPDRILAPGLMIGVN